MGAALAYYMALSLAPTVLILLAIASVALGAEAARRTASYLGGDRQSRGGHETRGKNGERFWLSRFPNTLGWVYRELQDFDMALGFHAEGARTDRENGYAKPEAYSHVNLAQDYMAVGEMTRVLEHLNRATELFGADVWFRWRYYIRAKAELARYRLIQGDTRQAQQYSTESIEIAEPRRVRKHLAWAHKILGDVARGPRGAQLMPVLNTKHLWDCLSTTTVRSLNGGSCSPPPTLLPRGTTPDQRMSIGADAVR